MILKVADRTPHAPWMPAFASGPSWTIAVGVRQRDLLDWLLGQNRPVLFIEPNERFADRLRQEGLDKWTDLYELVEVSLGSDKTEIPWYSYNDSRFDGPASLQVFQQNYPNLMVQATVQRPQDRLDAVAVDWLERQLLRRVQACGLLLIESDHPLAILQGANSLVPWLGSIVLLPAHPHGHGHGLGQGQQTLDQDQALDALLKAAHFSPDQDVSNGLLVWRVQPERALQTELQAVQAFLSESQLEQDNLKVERDQLLQQLEELHLHNGRLAEYRDHLETTQLSLLTQLEASQSCLQDLQRSHDQLEIENQELRFRQQELTVLVESSCQELAQLSDCLLAMPERLGPAA